MKNNNNTKKQATATESPAFQYVGEPYARHIFFRGQFIDPKAWSHDTIQSFIAQFPDTEGWFKIQNNENQNDNSAADNGSNDTPQ